LLNNPDKANDYIGIVLHPIIGNGRTDFIKMLLDNFITISFNNYIIVKICVTTNYVEIMQMLIDYGAKIDSELLMPACNSQSHAMVEFLLKLGLDPNVENGYPLKKLIKNPVNLHTINMLIDHGANVMINSEDLIKLAIKIKNPLVLKILLDAGVQVGSDTFNVVEDSKRDDVINLLLESGIDPISLLRYFYDKMIDYRDRVAW
jgi:ankyrin repeat protein